MDANAVVSISTALTIPAMCLIFALALLVVAVVLVHLLRAVLTVNQLRNAIAEAEYEQRRFTPKPPPRQAPNLGDEDDALEAIRIAREEREELGGNGAVESGDVITTDQNANMNDETPPIPESRMYRGG